MSLIIGGLLILWGVIILYSSLFRMKNEKYKDTGAIGATSYVELEVLFRFLLTRLPLGFAKGFIILIGISFVSFGIAII